MKGYLSFGEKNKKEKKNMCFNGTACKDICPFEEKECVFKVCHERISVLLEKQKTTTKITKTHTKNTCVQGTSCKAICPHGKEKVCSM